MKQNTLLGFGISEIELETSEDQRTCSILICNTHRIGLQEYVNINRLRPSSLVAATPQHRMCPAEVQFGFGLAASASTTPHTHWATISCLELCPHAPLPVLLTNFSLFGIVAKVIRLAHAIAIAANTKTSYVSC